MKLDVRIRDRFTKDQTLFSFNSEKHFNDFQKKVTNLDDQT